MHLSELERHILYLLLMDGSASVSKIAHSVGCRDHTVQSALKKFRENDLISRRVMIDVFRLGFSRHVYYISLSGEGQQHREEIIQSLVDSPYTSAVLEVGGIYNLYVCVTVRNAEELSRFHLAMSDQYSAPFVRKDVATGLGHAVFGEKVLLSRTDVRAESSYWVTSDKVETDQLDQKILFALNSPELLNLSSVARSLGLPQSTLDYRIKRLREQGVICGDLHELRGESIGLNNYLVLVSMKGLSEKLHKLFYEFNKQHSNVTHITHEIGHWDYMLGVAAERPREVNAFIDALHQHFGDEIASVQSCSMFRAHKVRDYPVLPEKQVLSNAIGA